MPTADWLPSAAGKSPPSALRATSPVKGEGYGNGNSRHRRGLLYKFNFFLIDSGNPTVTKKVRFEEMLPGQIIEARTAHPVAYLPIGGLEWHGRHNCIGLDAVKIHGVCMNIARETGGVVFPPLFYGDQREHHLMDANHDPDGLIAADYGLPKDNFRPGYMGDSSFERSEMMVSLLVHILHEMASFGFKVLVIAAGHYPLLSVARSACQLYYRDRGVIPWAFTGYELVRDELPEAGDHAGPWETSLMLALREDLVDLSKAKGPSAIDGLYEKVHEGSSAEYGGRALAALTRKVSSTNVQLLATLNDPEPSLFSVPMVSHCRGARNIERLHRDQNPPARMA